MSECPWLDRPGAMTTCELTSTREGLSRALQGTPVTDPGRAALGTQFAEVVEEQEARHRSEMASRGRRS
jgi:hypothetical protein